MDLESVITLEITTHEKLISVQTEFKIKIRGNPNLIIVKSEIKKSDLTLIHDFNDTSSSDSPHNRLFTELLADPYTQLWWFGSERKFAIRRPPLHMEIPDHLTSQIQVWLQQLEKIRSKSWISKFFDCLRR